MEAAFRQQCQEPDLQQRESLPIADFLKMHTAYDLLPDSGKVVVVDVGLTINSAFLALQENGHQ